LCNHGIRLDGTRRVSFMRTNVRSGNDSASGQCCAKRRDQGNPQGGPASQVRSPQTFEAVRFCTRLAVQNAHKPRYRQGVIPQQKTGSINNGRRQIRSRRDRSKKDSARAIPRGLPNLALRLTKTHHSYRRWRPFPAQIGPGSNEKVQYRTVRIIANRKWERLHDHTRTSAWEKPDLIAVGFSFRAPPNVFARDAPR